MVVAMTLTKKRALLMARTCMSSSPYLSSL
jgi:hypothetical protein